MQPASIANAFSDLKLTVSRDLTSKRRAFANKALGNHFTAARTYSESSDCAVSLGGGSSDYSIHVQSDIPEELSHILRRTDSSGASIVDLTKVKVVFGPQNASWWVSDGQTWRMWNLPPSLQGQIESNMEHGFLPIEKHPSILTLGAEGSFFVQNTDGSSSYHLDAYPSLEEFLSLHTGMSKRFKNVALDPYHYDAWIVHTVDEEVFSHNLPNFMCRALHDIEGWLRQAVDTNVENETLKAISIAEAKAAQESAARERAHKEAAVDDWSEEQCSKATTWRRAAEGWTAQNREEQKLKTQLEWLRSRRARLEKKDRGGIHRLFERVLCISASHREPDAEGASPKLFDSFEEYYEEK